jgi:branched-chain amino acid transport system ATP-binding protein
MTDTAATPAPSAAAADEPLLAVAGIRAGYGRREVLHDVSLHVGRGEIVTVLGHNGAGKTTMLRAIFGMTPLRGGRIAFDGADSSHASNVDNVRRGMTFTPAEAPIFRDLTVGENLDLGAFTVTDAGVRRQRRERVLELFPILEERRAQLAGTLSGGQQRMLSLGIALMAGPQLMLLDEPSLGIAPSLVQQIFGRIKHLSENEGLAVLIVEQNVRAALPIVDRAYFMRAGNIILEESGEAALARDHWWDLF